MTVELLTEQQLECVSLKGGCTGSSVSTLVNMPQCCKSHVAAHILKASKYDQKMTQLQTADQPVAPRGRDH